MNILNSFNKTLPAIGLGLLLTACGGGSSSGDSAAKTGRLVDSAVAGVAYQTPSYSGTTDANGQYHFIEGETVTFTIGANSWSVPAKAVLTPLDLAGSTDITNRKVINITRLLQTLDDDQNPANGINIPASANPVALNFDQDVADFETEANAQLAPLTLVDETTAMAHLQAELDELNAGTGDLDSEPASVPAAFIGSHTFKYEEINAGSGIADGALSTFEIQAGNKLKLPNGTVLSNPVYLNGNKAEVIWLDAATGLSYALSNALTATLNELNIAKGLFGSPGFQFYGQYSPFVEVDGDVPAALAAMDGSYTTQVNYSKAGNRNNWAVGDELTLSINGATGVIDVGGVYSIDPADESFSWTDNSSKNPTFNPAYEVLYKDSIKLIIYQRPGEPINSWRLTQDASASDGVNVWAHITPIIESHQNYLDALALQMPATLTVVEQDGSGSFFKGALCTEYPFDMDNNGTNGNARLMYTTTYPRQADYSPSSAAYEKNGTEQSLYWGGFMLAVDGTTLTTTEYTLGNALGVVLTNDAATIAAACGGDTTEPVVQSAVAPADFGTNAAPTTEEFLTLMASQSWPVAIYQTPEDHPEWYGQGLLTIGGSTSNWTMELKGADGSVIASLSADGAFTSEFKAFYELNFGTGPIPMPGHIFINKGTAITEYFNVFVEQPTGLIEGSLGGGGEVKFRNSMVAYGAGVPAIFAGLAGTWTGTWENWCVSPPKVDSNTITISEDGVVTLENTGSQGCDDVFPQSFSWGGYNDFLIPDPEETDGSYIMHIDATDFTNVSKGMLKIYFDASMNVTKFTAKTPSAYEMENPVKQ